MNFEPLPLPGAYLVTLARKEDDRGFFARLHCEREFADLGIQFQVKQANNSYNPERGTLRGFHFQRPPVPEDKLVRCIGGALVDVIVDLRAGSSTYGQHCMIELTPQNRKMIFVPKGFGHGYQSLTPDTEILYLVSEFYSKQYEDGLRFDDPQVGVPWPLEPTNVSDRDRAMPLLADFQPIQL